MENSQFFEAMPYDRDAIFNAAFPQARQLIRSASYLSGDDRSLLQQWVDDTVIPAIKLAPNHVKAELDAMLRPRNSAGIALGAAALDFFNGLLPHYPDNLAQAVAALIIVTAYELRDRNII